MLGFSSVFSGFLDLGVRDCHRGSGSFRRLRSLGFDGSEAQSIYGFKSIVLSLDFVQIVARHFVRW